MSGSIASSIKASNQVFVNLVWDKIKDYCGGGAILPVETVTNSEMTKYLDMLAGIDVWQVNNYQGMRGIASRVQWNYKSYRTFTVRYKINGSGNNTEYQKRKLAFDNSQYMYPYFTCQAYVHNETKQLLDCAVAKTADIFEAIDKYGYPQENGQDGNIFICLDWWRLNDIFIYPLAAAEFIARKRQHEFEMEAMEF